MNKKIFSLIFGMFLLVGATVPGVLAISNFNISSSIIGTTNSQNKLNVMGRICATESVVIGSANIATEVLMFGKIKMNQIGLNKFK